MTMTRDDGNGEGQQGMMGNDNGVREMTGINHGAQGMCHPTAH
jgi:hypothetical protein